MTVITIIILLILLCLAVGFCFHLMRLGASAKTSLAVASERLVSAQHSLEKTEKDNDSLLSRLAETEKQLKDTESDLAFQTQQAVSAKQEASRLAEQLAVEREANIRRENESKEQQKQLAMQTEANFKLLANEILKKQSDSLREENDRRIGEILAPLKENIDNFRKEVNECYSAEARERFSLQQRIKELVEANNNIGREAKELTAALRGNTKKQGDWGELVLENILENSGLRKGEEFTVQQQSADDGKSLRDENGRGLRPDVIVHCPDGRIMIIDSKVSLSAFTDYINAEDQETQQHYGKLHLASVKKHIAELSEKNYQDYIGKEKLDFVMMFIPNEGAFSAAMNLDPTIWQKAYDKRVLIVSPTQLVGSLRLIHQLWSHDRQTKNAIEIAERSGMMYDKFVGFISDMEKIEKSIKSTQTAYDEAMKKLRDGRGNLIGRAESLRKLGIKAAKRLPETYLPTDKDSDNDIYDDQSSE